MRNYIIFFIAIMALLSTACSEKQITEFTIEEIENDPEWVDVTKIDTVEACIAHNLFDENPLIINSEATYKEYNQKSLEYEPFLDKIRLYPELTRCTEEYQPSGIDFSSRSLILFYKITGGQPTCTRNLYRNDEKKMYIYAVKIQKTTTTQEGSGFSEHITIPKIKDNYKFKDKIIVKNPK